MDPLQPWSTDDYVNHTFSVTRFRLGYDQDEVDNFLDRCVAQLRVHRGERGQDPQEAIDAMRAAAEDRSQGWFARRTTKWIVKTMESMPTTVPDALPITSSEVASHTFTTTRMRDGYDAAEVDEVLDRLIADLAELEGGGRA
ncbi:DivIVA domain-containing protein [Agrococcus versicolor]